MHGIVWFNYVSYISSFRIETTNYLYHIFEYWQGINIYQLNYYIISLAWNIWNIDRLKTMNKTIFYSNRRYSLLNILYFHACAVSERETLRDKLNVGIINICRNSIACRNKHVFSWSIIIVFILFQHYDQHCLFKPFFIIYLFCSVEMVFRFSRLVATRAF